MNNRIAVITGASQGLGFATSQALAQKNYHTILTARSQGKVDGTLHKLKVKGLKVEGAIVDVADSKSIASFFEWLQRTHDRLDVLINNAGIIFETGGSASSGTSSILNTDAQTILDGFENNTLSAYRMIQHALPFMQKKGYGRIVNVSSGMGGLTEMGRGYPAYRISKAAMNAITRLVSQEVDGNIKINSVCPGWVKTAMGGSNATREIEKGIEGIVWAATLEDDGPNGGFFRDGKSILW